MRERFWRSRLSLVLATGLATIALISAIGAVQASGDGGRAGGHTPVTICHWVPAHGGSFVVITIDENGLNGHGDHENDIIPAGDDCDKKDDDDDKTHAPKTKTVVVTETAAAATNTPVATNTSPAATQTVTDGVIGGPDLTPEATNTSVAVATSTNTPEGGAGADTATPEATDTAAVGVTTTPGAGGGVLGESVAPGAGGAEALPESGTGPDSAGDPYQLGLIATAFAATAGAVTLLLRRRLYR